MKFGKTFESHLTTEWRQQYMNYTELKNVIREGVDNAPHGPSVTVQQIKVYFENFEKNFFALCHQELGRVGDFFAHKLAEARRKLNTLEIQLYSANGSQINQKSVNKRHLGLAFSEFYLSLIMLKNFQNLNYTAFRKICKKYDKYIVSSHGSIWFREYVSKAPFTEEKELKQMISDVEQLYTTYLTNGDRAKAMQKLRVPPLGQPAPPLHVFLSGLLLGLFSVSAVMTLISLYFYQEKTELIASFMRIYRGPFAAMVVTFYITLNVYVWQNVGVNHALIFDIDLRHRIRPSSFLEVSSGMGYICTMSMLFFLHHHEFGIEYPDYFHFPMMCFLLPLLLLINPIRIMNFPARMWILQVLGRICVAPAFSVNFADFWIAEQLTSMVLFLVDHYFVLVFYIKFYLNGSTNTNLEFEPNYLISAIRCLPHWFRLAQCLRRYWDSDFEDTRHSMNAIKYGSGIVVVIFSTVAMETNSNYESMFDNPWISGYVLSAFISSIYYLYWDYYWDFGFFQVWKGDNMFLRENLIYRKWLYYFVIVENALIRFAWAFELVMVYHDILTPYNCKTITSFLELVRRCFWNFLRLENEHLYNCGHFRAIRDISLKPIERAQSEFDAKRKTN